jgi:hypothetical protein
MKDFLKDYFDYSEKQLALMDYLLKRLGFTNNEFTINYIKSLANKANTHKNIRAIPYLDPLTKWDLESIVENDTKTAFIFAKHLKIIDESNKNLWDTCRINEIKRSLIEILPSDSTEIKKLLIETGIWEDLKYGKSPIVASQLNQNQNYKDVSVDKYYFDGQKWLPDKYDIIDFLIDEYRIKKNKKFSSLTKISDYSSATDLANFAFCPVGYSIGNSFKINVSDSAQKGIKFHEETKLISLINFIKSMIESKKIQNLKSAAVYITDENKDFFSELLKSKLIYSGHSDDQKEYFKNDDLKYIGAPDYIFQDRKNRNYLIEEKFIKISNKKENSFSFNHKIQLASCIYFLKEIDAQYGYLVYWYYTYSNWRFEFIKCKIYKISRGDKMSVYLQKIYEDLNKFKKSKFYNLNLIKLEGNKCASCLFVMYCGHKNGKKKQVMYPYYGKGYYNLCSAKFPEILKKLDKDSPKEIEKSEKIITPKY